MVETFEEMKQKVIFEKEKGVPVAIKAVYWYDGYAHLLIFLDLLNVKTKYFKMIKMCKRLRFV